MRRIRSGESTAARYAESSADPLIGVRRIRGLFYVDLASRQGQPMLSDALAPSHAEHDASAEDSALDELAALDTDERGA
ncbi:hypothetical protein X879_4620 [Burkholderia pseudomallei MSHR3951]|nr:hypothetical protein X944_3014 [Burkholderia pseudomallei MSHR3964]KGV92527.1 hypothetical protein X892_3058 [Burkholderia pseudomallei MSHR3960]KGV93873.1 hypothetical protein X879_4620 [Burkholderia pseudomallei MSHR3951]